MRLRTRVEIKARESSPSRGACLRRSDWSQVSRRSGKMRGARRYWASTSFRPRRSSTTSLPAPRMSRAQTASRWRGCSQPSPPRYCGMRLRRSPKLRSTPSMQPLAALARGFAPLRAPLGAVRRIGAIALLPESGDQDRRDGKLVDHAQPLFLGVHPVEVLRIVIAVRQRFDRQHPVARGLLRVERLPFLLAKQHAGHESFAPCACFGRAALVLLRFRVIQERLEASRRFRERAADALLQAKHQRQNALGLLVVLEHGGHAALTVAP